MKIVLSFDSFKGGMSAKEACTIARDAVRSVKPDAEIEMIPLGDGGEGTGQILSDALGGEWIATETMGPLPSQKVNSGFVWVASRNLAIVEMARSSGLPLVPTGCANPLQTTTYGTGELLRAAIDQGAKEIWLTVGGSATVDGGVGAATALGWQFLDAQGNPIGLGGGALSRLVRLVRPPLQSASFPPCKVLCDVVNPLIGPEGAARVFGPQKGATPEMVAILEQGLEHLADVIEAQLARDVRWLPSGGAAGGLAAGAAAFWNAQIVSGIETVLNATRFEERARNADWILTGEGSFDRQSLQGKVVSGVSQIARKMGVRVAVLAGSVRLSENEWRRAGIDHAYSLAVPDMTIKESIMRERELLARRVREFLAGPFFLQ